MRSYTWNDGKKLTVGEKTIVMGILNGTPDSFSDGGKYNDLETALAHMTEMETSGAAIIDVGFESTRPGHVQISEEVEITRMKELLPALVKHATVPLSVDTYRAKPAAYALSQGVHILNDIWGLQYDSEIASVAAQYDVPVCIMHNQEKEEYKDIIDDIKAFFNRSFTIAAKAGIREENIWLDPGFGFGKNFSQHITLYRRLGELIELGYPILLGPSRKRFIGAILQGVPFSERDAGTMASCVGGALMGAAIMRVHNVKMAMDGLAVSDALWGNGFFR